MLAYVFWHTPRPGRADGYERRLTDFHARMAQVPIPGFRGSASVRVTGLPWMDGPGYEDWYLVEDYGALGALNAGAVDGRHVDAHDPVALDAGWGAGGLYALRDRDGDGGDGDGDDGDRAGGPAGTHGAWLSKPDGERYPEFLARLEPHVSAAGAALWQRQLVLGPAPEFRITADRELSLPADLEAVRCTATPVAGTAGEL